MRPGHALLLPLLVVLALPAAAPASRYRVGIGEQDVTMFSDKAFKPLKLRTARYIASWDWRRNPIDLNAFIAEARRARVSPLIHFGSSANCYNGKRIRRIKRCRAPSVGAYTASFRAFRRAYPSVREFGAWNEANHRSQPTHDSPRRAAAYYNAMRRACPSCTIVAADLLDSSNLIDYVETFQLWADGEPRLWGLHNYSDVNRRRSTQTRRFLQAVPGNVWLTESGGIVSFGRTFPYSTARAKSRLGYLFTLADRFSRRLRGLRSRITRVYPYEWRGEHRGARFDAGIVGPTGKPRPAYALFRAKLRSRSR